MIFFWDGASFPLDIQAGDILFLAGCLKTKTIPFEHVALVAESRRIETAEQFLDLRTYGLPESSEKVKGLGLDFSSGRRWLGHRAVTDGYIGSRATAWNLAARLDGVDAATAGYMLDIISFKHGSVEWHYLPKFVVDAELSSPLKTNCLGFVCSVFEYMRFTVVAHTFPRYRSPYTKSPDDREYPSPGHLAHALEIWLAADQAYHPASVSEAEEFAPAAKTFREAAGSR
jgi:hypothetical protein